MRSLRFQAGLPISHAPAVRADAKIAEDLTDEAALTPSRGEELRLDLVVDEDAVVTQGQPLARLRNAPAIALVAPMAGRVARIELRPGRRLVQIVLFRDEGGDRHRFDTTDAEIAPERLRSLMQGAGIWRMIRSRPFGHMPYTGESPAAILVMAADSRPGASDPQRALEYREEAFERGLSALTSLTQGPVFLCARPGPLPGDRAPGTTRVTCGALHPMGLPGFHIHRLCPATPRARVWDIHAEDVADLGTLLATGRLPETRLVSLTGAALREPRLVRCQPGADLRGLSRAWVHPGPHEVHRGSILDGEVAHWLGPRDRQATILPQGARQRRPHWFQAALLRAARPLPIIPTAALTQALGGDLPAAALVRALGAGDVENAARLGALSLLEEDLALADYVTAADPPLSVQLRHLLDRVAHEELGE